jgi:hypothetical protein
VASDTGLSPVDDPELQTILMRAYDKRTVNDCCRDINLGSRPDALAEVATQLASADEVGRAARPQPTLVSQRKPATGLVR